MAARANSYARRHRAFDREATASVTAAKEARTAEIQARIHKRAEADASAHRDIASLKPGDSIRTRHGWHEIVRVNKKSVSVKTPYSWEGRIPLEKIIETRTGKTEQGGES